MTDYTTPGKRRAHNIPRINGLDGRQVEKVLGLMDGSVALDAGLAVLGWSGVPGGLDERRVLLRAMAGTARLTFELDELEGAGR